MDNSDIVLIYTSSPKKFCLGLGINILVQPDSDYFLVTLKKRCTEKEDGLNGGIARENNLVLKLELVLNHLN